VTEDGSQKSFKGSPSLVRVIIGRMGQGYFNDEAGGSYAAVSVAFEFLLEGCFVEFFHALVVVIVLLVSFGGGFDVPVLELGC